MSLLIARTKFSDFSDDGTYNLFAHGRYRIPRVKEKKLTVAGIRTRALCKMLIN